MPAPRALRIGLTGGIGSGKSTVAALLAAHGAAVFDTDAIARQLAAPGGVAMPAIAAAFGPGVIDADGGLDRERMRALVFADTTAGDKADLTAAATPTGNAKRRLEAILHPLIGAETERLAAASNAAVHVFDVPLLVESDRWRAHVDRVLVVDCSVATQVERVLQRSGWQAATVQAVIARQAPREARRAAADAVLHNDGIPRDVLSRQVTELWARWCPGAPGAPGALGICV